MAKFDFTEILDQEVGSAPKPKPLPVGSYIGQIASLPKVRPVTLKDGSTAGILTITINLTEAGEDVDQTLLEEAGGIQRNGKARSVRADFWQDTDAETGWSWKLDAFLEDFGHTSGAYSEAFKELVGRSVVVLNPDEYGKVEKIYAQE